MSGPLNLCSRRLRKHGEEYVHVSPGITGSLSTRHFWFGLALSSRCIAGSRCCVSHLVVQLRSEAGTGVKMDNCDTGIARAL